MGSVIEIYIKGKAAGRVALLMYFMFHNELYKNNLLLTMCEGTGLKSGFYLLS